MHRALIVGCLTASTLALVVAAHSAPLKKEKHEKPKTTPIMYSASARRDRVLQRSKNFASRSASSPESNDDRRRSQ